MGRTAAPAAVVEYPWSWIRSMGYRKKKTPIAAYRKNVMRFAPLKARDLNSASGRIAEDEGTYAPTKIPRQATPPSILPNTSGLPQPNFTDSSNAVTTPPKPAVAHK